MERSGGRKDGLGKLYGKPEAFNGHAAKWYEFKSVFLAHIYAKDEKLAELMETVSESKTPFVARDLEEESKSAKLYNILLSLVRNQAHTVVVSKGRSDNNGLEAWRGLRRTYEPTMEIGATHHPHPTTHRPTTTTTTNTTPTLDHHYGPDHHDHH